MPLSSDLEGGEVQALRIAAGAIARVGRRSRAVAVALAFIAALGAHAAVARAGTAYISGTTLEYDALSGEINSVRVGGSDTTVSLTDDSVTVTPGAGCTGYDAHT